MIFLEYVYVTKQANVLTRTLKGPKSLKSVVRVWNGPRCPYHLIRVVCLSERQSFSSYSARQRGLMLNLWCHCSLLWALMSPLNERKSLHQYRPSALTLIDSRKFALPAQSPTTRAQNGTMCLCSPLQVLSRRTGSPNATITCISNDFWWVHDYSFFFDSDNVYHRLS